MPGGARRKGRAVDEARPVAENLTKRHAPLRSEGANLAKKRGRPNRTDMQEVERLKLGCRPFAAAIKHYLDRRYGTVAESTYKEEERKLRYLAGVFEKLKDERRINTTDPRHMTRREIQEFMAWMRREGLDPVAQAKYLQYLKGFLKCYKNFVMDEMKADGVRFPKPTKKPIRVIAEGDLDLIFRTLGSLEEWRGSVARGMIALYFATGVRPKELGLAHCEDLNLQQGTLFVRHPKGEGSWASAEPVDIIRPDMLPLIKRYLFERQEYLTNQGTRKATALFPNLYRGQDDFYSANAFNEIKHIVEELSGIEFKLKDFRSTLTTMTVNGDLSRLPAMSAQLRHTNLATTQRSYFRMQQGVAGKQLKDAWKEHPIVFPENTVIKKDIDYTGYV